ncbi:undecaprenyl-phosphate glucose phosphotransferase [Ramlibacter tataouinensis]|uniref:Candidate sugar-1-phosphate transferase, membrane protein n=1 Tax=Ramlibacter tataouinensis (strain ATCC BAA-407 / DSM 14655 / LMG 21543 / TTB310) TaxID=365046 RepID=F5Y0E0_RAMTT|nr:undecaprenyl-phosphate glucose phosphotransferase [Ramlibacter tataouinensis]AEG92162.1 candidate sugar-1-phosphate transferase, membrane protein [Ramlibacter tataouinensis TTB310]
MREAESFPGLGSIAELRRGATAANESRLLLAVEAVLEPLLAVLSLWLLVWLFQGALTPVWLVTSVLAFALAYPGRPQLRAPAHKVVANTLLGWSWIAALLLATGLATGHLGELPRPVIMNWLWFAPASQLLGHWALRKAAPHLVRLQGPPLRAVVVGLNEQGASLADRLTSSAYAGIELVGYFDDRGDGRHHRSGRYKLLGRLTDVAAFVKTHRVQLIYLSLPMASQPRIKELLDALKDTTASVYFVPDMFVTDLIQGRTDSVCGMPVISVCETPFRGHAGLMKRASDIVLSALILLLLSPLLLAIAAAVKLGSPGPVIFRQRRYGLDGQEIVVYKFRSMTVTEDGSSIQQARRNDQRVTRLGAFLRRTSMDELPQFINVLQGRMSIVGPRPHAVAHNEFYRSLIKSYMIRHKVKPGITGWAQVNGYRGETDSLEKMEGRVRYDLDYLRNWSIRLDLYIIFRTVRLVFRDSAAY